MLFKKKKKQIYEISFMQSGNGSDINYKMNKKKQKNKTFPLKSKTKTKNFTINLVFVYQTVILTFCRHE